LVKHLGVYYIKLNENQCGNHSNLTNTQDSSTMFKQKQLWHDLSAAIIQGALPHLTK